MTPVMAILGPTASGKSAVAMTVAEQVGGEIIACDAMTVYRGLDLGTAKASAEDRARIPHHLLDVVELGEPYDVNRYVHDAGEAVADCRARGKVPILCGGSGLYARALLYQFEPLPAEPTLAAELRARFEADGIEPLLAELAQLDPATATRTKDNPRRVLRALEAVKLIGGPIPDGRDFGRPAMPNRQYVLMPSADDNRRRIGERAAAMLAGGWIEETRRLLDQGLLDSPTARQAIGYDLIARHLSGEMDFAALQEKIITQTCRYAKRQRTWFRNQHPDAVFLAPSEKLKTAADFAATVVADWRTAQ